MKVTIDLDKVGKLVKEADKILLDKAGEQTILGLLKVREKIDEAVKQAKKNIEDSALKMDKNFSSVQGDKIKVAYRAYGARYKIDESRLKDLPESLYKKTIRYYPEAKAIDDWANENGLPLGIEEPVRVKQIVISVKK